VCLGLDCKVEYTNANKGIMPEAHRILVQYVQSEENDLHNTFEGQNSSFPVLYFSWTPPNQVPPISGAPASWQSNIEVFQEV
jgi:hypothetical protein